MLYSYRDLPSGKSLNVNRWGLAKKFASALSIYVGSIFPTFLAHPAFRSILIDDLKNKGGRLLFKHSLIHRDFLFAREISQIFQSQQLTRTLFAPLHSGSRIRGKDYGCRGIQMLAVLPQFK